VRIKELNINHSTIEEGILIARNIIRTVASDEQMKELELRRKIESLVKDPIDEKFAPKTSELGPPVTIGVPSFFYQFIHFIY